MTSYNEPLAATDPVFTAELLKRLQDQMKKGKAAGLDNIHTSILNIAIQS